MNYKQKALDHVRSVCPELMKRSNGCALVKNHKLYLVVNDRAFHGGLGLLDTETNEYFEVNWQVKGFVTIGHTPHLEHWLRGIDVGDTEKNGKDSRQNYCVTTKGSVSVISPVAPMYHHILHYNLTKDGENQSEEFYKAYCKIVGIL